MLQNTCLLLFLLPQKTLIKSLQIAGSLVHCVQEENTLERQPLDPAGAVNNFLCVIIQAPPLYPRARDPGPEEKSGWGASPHFLLRVYVGTESSPNELDTVILWNATGS